MNRTKIKVHPAAIAIFTDASWEFAHKQLWKNYPFSQAEEHLQNHLSANITRTFFLNYFPLLQENNSMLSASVF
ncbi:MAG: hypothetical protein K1X56_08380 [Flavobacteriales bacterium]|nr:hypothetical protein [Flavobacteriales bacterium]